MSEPKALAPGKSTNAQAGELSNLLVPLLKGVVYRENDEPFWQSLMKLQSAVRDYVGVLDLELHLDESEGYSFLRTKTSIQTNEEEVEPNKQIQRLMPRRQLSFPVSLLLALLRRRLAEFDQRGGDTRLVLSRTEIVDMVRVFFADTTNETKFISQIETHLNKITELGFLKKLKPTTSASEPDFEVRRILKAFVDAQWLHTFDIMLQEYRKHAASREGVADDE